MLDEQTAEVLPNITARYAASASIRAPAQPHQSLPPIHLVPERGMVLMCDFQGMRTREIGHKTRPVVVLSPRADNDITVTVMPFSRSVYVPGPTNILIPADRYLFFTPGTWAVGSCVHDVEHSRLGGILVQGRRHTPYLQPDDLQRILVAARWRLRDPSCDPAANKNNLTPAS